MTMNTGGRRVLLKVSDLSVRFGRGADQVRAVEGVSFSLAPSEQVAVVGRSGSGKSQCMLALLGLVRGTPGTVDGNVTFDGSPVVRDGRSLTGPKGLSAVRGGGIGMVFQHPRESLVPWNRIEDHVRETSRRFQLDDVEAEVRGLFDSVGIAQPDRILRAYPHMLSGGEAQRVAVALALLPRPRLLIADEPTSALDAIIRLDVLRVIRDMARSRSAALLLVTHDLGSLPGVVDRVLVMSEGRLVQDEPLSCFLEGGGDDLHPASAALVEVAKRRSMAWSAK